MDILSSLKANVKAEGHRTAKFLDTISGWFGFTAKQTKDDADAKAYQIVKLAEAQKQVALIEDETNAELFERATNRQKQRIINHQKNIEDISLKAAGYLNEKSEGEIDNEPVAEEWKAQFFEFAKNITQEQLQEFWAKLLAEEIAKPTSISSRALHILYHISAHEATLFQRIVSLVTDDGQLLFTDGSLELFEVSYSHVLLLQEAGLFTGSDPVGSLRYSEEIDGYLFANRSLRLNEKLYKFKGPTPNRPRLGPVLSLSILTSTGCLIGNIVKPIQNEQYFHELSKAIGQDYSFVELTVEEIKFLGDSTS